MASMLTIVLIPIAAAAARAVVIAAGMAARHLADHFSPSPMGRSSGPGR